MENTLYRDYANARKGSRDAFLSILVRYQSLVFGYYRTSGVHVVTEALTHTQKLFYDLWRDLGMLPKPIDFERELIHRLKRFAIPVTGESGDERMAALLRLSPADRLLVVTIEIENWSIARAAKAFQESKYELEKRLLSLRCDWIGVHFINLNEAERRILREMSTHFCKDTTRKHKRRMADAAVRCPELREFKSRCLEKKCELVELWLDLRLTAEEQEWLMQGVGDLLGRQEWRGVSRNFLHQRWFGLFRKANPLG